MRTLKYGLIASAVSCLALMQAFRFKPAQWTNLGGLEANAQAPQACQWAYDFNTGIARATYCGNVIVNGTLTFNGGLPAVQLFGSLANGNVVVGGPGGTQVHDSGNQMIMPGFGTVDPVGSIQNGSLGFSNGSIYQNTNTNALWVAGNVTLTSATWTQATPSTPFSYAQFAWNSISTVTLGATYYSAPGNLSGSQNVGGQFARGGIISNMCIRLQTAPGTGQTDTFTLMAGTPAAMTDTGISCVLSGTAQICPCTGDGTPSFTVTAGQAFAVRIVPSSASAATTGFGQYGFQEKSQ